MKGKCSSVASCEDAGPQNLLKDLLREVPKGSRVFGHKEPMTRVGCAGCNMLQYFLNLVYRGPQSFLESQLQLRDNNLAYFSSLCIAETKSVISHQTQGLHNFQRSADFCWFGVEGVVDFPGPQLHTERTPGDQL